MRLTRWWSSSTCEGLSSGLTKGPLNAVRPFPDEDSALFPSPSIIRKTASKASMRKSAPLRRGERDCDIGLPLGCCYTGDLRDAQEDRSASPWEGQDYQPARLYWPTRCQVSNHHWDSNGHRLGKEHCLAHSQKHTLASLNRNHLH